MSKLTMGRFAFESGVALDPCAAGATPCAKRSATGGGARSSPTSSDGSCRRSRQTTATSEATWRWYFTIRLKCSEPSPRIAGNASASAIWSAASLPRGAQPATRRRPW